MRYRTFLGRKTSVIAMGSTGLGLDFSQVQTNELLDAYVAVGGNFIDTARVYGDFGGEVPGIAEHAIGNWMAARHNRDRLVIGTKGGHPRLSTIHTGRLSRAELESDLSESLDALGTDCVEIYWLHRDDASRPVGDILETLNRFLQDGRVRGIGCSNWKPDRIREANAYAAAHGMTGFYADQPQYSLARQAIVEDDTLCVMDDALHAWHCESGMPAVCFSSQAKGFFIKYAAGGEEALSPKAKRRFLTEENMAVMDRLKELSAETGYSVGALSLAWLMAQPFDVYPIIGASRPEQVEALREAGDAVITPEQAKMLRER